MNESRLISEFMTVTGANPKDALQCLRAWDWDLKRAITDYNDTYHFNYNSNEQDSYETDDSSRNLIDYNNEFDDRGGDYNKQNKIVIIPQSSSGQQSSQGKYMQGKEKKPVLTKADSIDLVDCRKLSRGISRATDNKDIVSKARTEIAMDFRGNTVTSSNKSSNNSSAVNSNNNSKKNIKTEEIPTNASVDTPDFTFILPNIFIYKDSFRIFLEKDLIECSTCQALEQSNHLNWWVDHGLCRKLWPLATTGDGNCLLHAASLGMWGFHDRKLTLRKALHSILTNGKCRDALWRRWRFQQTRLNKRAGFVYSEVEWTKEWDELISMSSPEPRGNNLNVRTRRFSSSADRHSLISSESIDDSATYESLEEIHILALAHVLRRTIIVVSDTVLKDLNGEAMAPITFGGVYLPFEIDASECNRGPLLLAYDMAHFSALVPMETGSEYPPALIPLVDYENVLLPIQFCIDPGENFNWVDYDGTEGNWALSEREQMALLKEYLDIVYATNSATPDDEVFDDLTDDEYEKKFVESEVIIPSNQNSQLQHPSNQYNFVQDEPTQQNKSKAAKQLQSVAKQFGSIGKSMSKKIKKNIGSITKIGNKNNGGKAKSTLSSGSSTHSFTCTRLLCAKLRIKRHEYQEEMIKNYLECARKRYLELEKNRDKSIEYDRHQLEMLQLTEPDIGVVYCVNIGCNNFANSETSYLCYECYEKQKQRESNTTYTQLGPRYGTGKSKFYTQADTSAHESIKNIPPAKRLNDMDQTLYLSNSTFFNDNNIMKNNTNGGGGGGGSGSNSSTNSSNSLSNYTNISSPPAVGANTNISGNNLVNRDSSYRHGYSPTVRLINEELEEFNNSSNGTVSVFSPGNTINSNLNTYNNNNTTTTTSTQPHQPITRIIKIELEQDRLEQSPIINSPKDKVNKNDFDTKPCKTLGCNFFGTLSTNFYCSKCYQQINKNDPLIDINSSSSSSLSSPLSSASNSSGGGSGLPPPPPSSNVMKTTIVSSTGKPTTIYPTATATITKTGNKLMSDI